MSCYRIIYCLTKTCRTLINNDEGGYCIRCWNKKDKKIGEKDEIIKIRTGMDR